MFVLRIDFGFMIRIEISASLCPDLASFLCSVISHLCVSVPQPTRLRLAVCAVAKCGSFNMCVYIQSQTLTLSYQKTVCTLSEWPERFQTFKC